MKKILAIIMAIGMLASVLCVPAFAADNAPAPDIVLRISAFSGYGDTLVIGDYDNFVAGWNEAMIHASNPRVDRIIVDIYTDWVAKDGKFIDGKGYGFDNDTIYIPEEAKLMLNLNGHTINRGLTEDEGDGEVIFINDDADVIINNGTITGGYSNSEGGGLYIEGGANVTLNDVHIVGNKVHNDDGAGIYMYGGSNLTVNGGSFENNTTNGNGWATYYGGAVYVEEGTVKFNNVVFKNNQCKDDGAAIYAYKSKVMIDGCTFDGNNAQSSIVYGENSEFHVGKSNFINNNSNYLFELDSTSLSAYGSVFKNNDHSYIIMAEHDNWITIYGGTEFTDNNACVMYATQDGVNVNSYFGHCTFNNNYRAKDHNDEPAGSFCGDFINMIFSDCDLGNSDLNYAENVSIQYTDLSSDDIKIGVSLYIDDFTAYQRFDLGWEDAMKYVKDDRVKSVTITLYADWNAENGVFGTLDNGFKNNTLYIPEDQIVTLNLNGHTINRGLTEDMDDGEVIHVDSGAHLIINDGTITGGFSNSGAGGIYIESGANVTLNNVNIDGNKVKNDDGAGIGVYGGATLTMNGGSISNNVMIRDFSADVYGGGIYVEDSTATLTDVVIKNNSYDSGSADEMYGSAVYSTDSKVTLINCTVEGNGVTKDDSDYYCTSTIYAEDSTLVIENTSFIGNGSKNIWQRSEYSDDYRASTVISANDTDLTMSGGKFTDNNQVFLLSLLDSVVTVDGVDFTGNKSLALSVYVACSAPSTFSNCKFDAGSTYREFDYDFQFKSKNEDITFVDCDFGKATFSDKNAVKFDGGNVSNVIGSIFGEGSLALIVASVALIASIASIIVNVTERKKKTVPVTATEQSENDE